MNEVFLGYEFTPIELKNNKILSGFLTQHPQTLTGYTFASLAAWQPFFRYGWVFAEPGTLLISCAVDPDPHRYLLQPVGPLSVALSRKILEEAARLPYPLKIIGASNQFLLDNPEFAAAYKVEEDHAISNYLYQADALARLPGRKYSKKRNLLSQATAQYNWTVQPLTSVQIDSCFEVLNAIQIEEKPKIEGMLQRELAALEFTLHHFDEFCQQGLLVMVKNRPAAFSIYEPINPRTVAIHFERALRSYKGLYQVVNMETAKAVVGQGFEFINREEDMGDEGLRDAKLSYHPINIIPAYELTFK
jgi:hypothetical protein